MDQIVPTAASVLDEVTLTAQEVRDAAARIGDKIVRTPTMYSRTLSEITGANIWLKFENHQFTASYKERGALNALMQLSDERKSRGVIAASAGNHAQGLSHHGTGLGIPVTIVMPRTTPLVKVMQSESVGGNVVLEGESFDDAYAHARKLEVERGLTFVHPFDDPHVAAGQGTVALEMLEDAPEIDTLVVPIGGGGLASGMCTMARDINPDIRLIGVEAQLYPSMYNLLKGMNLPIGGDTLAEGIAVFSPGRFTSRTLRGLLDELLLVGEPRIESTLALLLQIEKTLVEGAGACGLGAVIDNPDIFAGRNVGIVLSGGNIDTRLLANVLLRDLARSGRLARLKIGLQDRAGALFKVAKVFHEHNVNIIEVLHQRIFTHLPAKGLVTEIECEARDAAQLDKLVAALRRQGYEVKQVETD